MTNFEQAGEALLLAQQGNAQIARTIAAALSIWTTGLKDWLARMPTTLPPTEYYGR